jgi:hypothetical protein
MGPNQSIEIITARQIRIGIKCQKEIERFLRELTPDKLLDPRTWEKLPVFVRVIPNGDILPSRSKYSSASNDWQVAVNYLYASDHEASEGLWYSLPDVAVSVLLTGQVPQIIDAFKLVPEGKYSNLRSVLLGGEIPVNPRTQDLFRTVIEQRKSFSKKKNVPREEMDRLDKALKVFANASSYGIYAEMNRQETEKRVKLKCQGIDPEPYECSVIHPEKPGEFCFPPLASLITGAARLMLALLEHCITELGGTYAMEDTDSMAIVTTKHGGFIPCPGGNLIKNGVQGVHALSWKQVDQIVKRFEALNPYNRQIISGSVLKIEDDNFDPKTGKQRQLHCQAISAKRYALFTLSQNGEPELLREGKNNKKDHWSRHGLGHLLNPTDPDASDRDWTAAVWNSIIRRAFRLKVKKLPFSRLPAIGRTTVSSPFLIKSLESLNAAKPYSEQIKPFNFLLTSHVSAFGHPLEVDPERFHLISPYDSDSRKWLEKDWTDQHSGKRYRITTKGDYGTRYAARVKTYRDVVAEYESHPEAKCSDSKGNPCDRQTVGLLRRRHIKVDQIKSIGKESNSLEDIEEGTLHSQSNVYTEYADPKRSEWICKTQPALKKLPLHILVETCGERLSRRELIELRAGRSKPHRKTRELLTAILKTLL